jgi:hypothetical protein
MPKVGRNPPCPCGSSKQHKRRSPAGDEATSRAARCLFAIVPGWAHAAQAEPGPCERPAIELLRYDEDHAFLRDPSCRTDLHLGAQVRMFVQLTSNFAIGRAGGPGHYDTPRMDEVSAEEGTSMTRADRRRAT